MIGSGIIKGLGVTLKHFIETYVEDFRYYSKKPADSILEYRMDPHTDGIYTMQYPEEQPVIPEAFRFLPFLVTDYEGEEFDKRAEQNRCTSCGICAKACPPQCIWIVRTTDPKTGKPVPQPKEFYIDTDICMNCGYCAEFCPFDAIIMDHEFALADYARDDETHHVHDLDRLMQPASYYKEIRPVQYAQKEEERIFEEAEKKRKAEEKAKKLAAKKAAAAAKAAEGGDAKEGALKDGDAKPAAKAKRSPEEIKAQREAMMAKKKAKAEAKEKGDEGQVEAPPAKRKRTPEEIQAQREAMMAKRRAKQEGKEE